MQVPGYWRFERIGQGAYADIYRGENASTRAKVAIKQYKNDPLSKSDLAQLAAEVRASEVLKHKGIIRIVEHIETENHNFVIMSPCANTDLLRHLNSRACRISEEIAKSYFAQLIQILLYTHSKGIVHLDVKLENLLLHADRLVLSDWGLSLPWSRGTTFVTGHGSLVYSCPEILEQRPIEGPEADVWSAGVVLYALCCGSLPFQGKDAKSFRQAMETPLQLPAELSLECRDLITRMLAVETSQRIKLSSIIGHPWLKNHRPLHYSGSLSDSGSHIGGSYTSAGGGGGGGGGSRVERAANNNAPVANTVPADAAVTTSTTQRKPTSLFKSLRSLFS